MPRIALTDARVRALKRRKTTYDIRDGKLRGFGIRVLPSGAKRYFIHSQHRGRRVWKIVGEVGSIGADEARARAKSLLAAIREGSAKEAAASPDIAFETIADEVFRRYARNWKPSTLKVNRNYYRNHILPRFKGRPIAGIDSRDVRQWFASLHAKPAAADRSAPILSVIMRQAEIYGYRPEGSNPCKGIKRYRREGRERFLVSGGNTQLGGGTRPLRGRPSATGRHHQAAIADRVSRERGSHAEVALPARRQAVPARQQDRAANDLAVVRRPRDPGPRAANGKLDVPFAEDERPPQP